ncbi:MAG: NADP-dependent isocitrate dehydrogenase [Myxococcales bacterium]|nr:NADP-dependent isocitrate dehydrogenase [Myxococcales bacterium]
MSNPIPISVALGDGIGPEVTRATLQILAAADARIAPEEVELGERVYRRGISSGVDPAAWESIRRTRVLLKGPLTTPQGGGFKSVNVTLRKALGLFANVRPAVSYSPFVSTLHPKLDVIVVRENEEDLYAGIEHRQTDEVMQCLKLISRPGCERIVRYAFALARAHGRRKVTCMTKDNIMKMTDGLFSSVFREVARDYPDLATEHMIIDIGAARLADTPERFDVIVTLNLYGDILSDIAAQLTGSVGLAGSANIGSQAALFEAIHGSAPDIAGRGIANPSGMILSAVMMLSHIGQPDIATAIHNAWLCALEDGCHTADIHRQAAVGRPLRTDEFAAAIIDRLGQAPQALRKAVYHAESSGSVAAAAQYERPAPLHKALVGVDLFVHFRGGPGGLSPRVQRLANDRLKLSMITNRGVKVWPDGLPETFCTDHYRCRFQASTPTGDIQQNDIIELLQRMQHEGLDFIKAETLCTFDGVPGYALGQGQ